MYFKTITAAQRLKERRAGGRAGAPTIGVYHSSAAAAWQLSQLHVRFYSRVCVWVGLRDHFSVQGRGHVNDGGIHASGMAVKLIYYLSNNLI